jgi:hypothetical protein
MLKRTKVVIEALEARIVALETARINDPASEPCHKSDESTFHMFRILSVMFNAPNDREAAELNRQGFTEINIFCQQCGLLAVRKLDGDHTSYFKAHQTLRETGLVRNW